MRYTLYNEIYTIYCFRQISALRQNRLCIIVIINMRSFTHATQKIYRKINSHRYV